MQIALVQFSVLENAANVPRDCGNITTKKLRDLSLGHQKLVAVIVDLDMEPGSISINQKTVSRGFIFLQMYWLKL